MTGVSRAYGSTLHVPWERELETEALKRETNWYEGEDESESSI